MKKIILQPVDGDNEFKYYFDTVKNPVDLDKIKKHVNQEESDSLSEIYGSRQVHIWGVPADGDETNVSKWNSIEPGDLALFSGEDRIFASAVVTHKIHNQDLASDLWGPEEKGDAREYIFFLDELKDKNLPYVEFNKIAGYPPDYIVKAFNVLDEQKSSLILKAIDLEKNVVTDKEDMEKSDSTSGTETQTEQPSEEEPEDASTDSEKLEASDSTSDTEAPAEQPSEEEPEDTSSDPEGMETSDSKSETETQTEQPPEKEPEDTSTDSKSLETSSSVSDTEAPAEKPPEEKPEDASNDSEDQEDFVPIDFKSDTKSRVKHKFLINMIILTVALLFVIGVIRYFIYSDRQQKQHGKQDLQETKDLKKTSPSEIPSKYMESGFRKTEWGMTKEQVKAIEHIEIAYENDTAILYYGLVAGMEASIYYTFAEGKLVESMHHFTEKHIDDNDYILDYKKVKDALTQIYGLPVTDEQLWSDEEYKDDPQDWGFAIRSGDLSFRSNWETDTAKIGLGLYNDNNEIIHGVVHANK